MNARVDTNLAAVLNDRTIFRPNNYLKINYCGIFMRHRACSVVPRPVECRNIRRTK
jgi:hypothetical protein